MKFIPLLALLISFNISLFAAEPAFRFDFTKPTSDKSISDVAGQHLCTSTLPLLIEEGGLRIDYGAKISIPTDSVPSITNDFSIVLWVAYSEEILQGVGQYQPILSKGLYDKKIDFTLAIQDGLPLFVYSVPREAGLGGISLVGHTYGRTTRYAKPEWVQQEPIISQKRWTQLAVTRSERTLRIYKNGFLILENPNSPKPSAPTDEPLILGAERLRDEKDNRITGNLLINNLRMYGKALTNEDIQDLYAKEKAQYTSVTPTLQPTRHYYPSEMAEYSAELDTELPMVRDHRSVPVEGTLIGRSWIEKERVGEIMTEGGSIYPLAGYPYIGLGEERYLRQSERFVKDFSAAQVNIITATFARPMFWTDEESYDWSVVDKTYQEIVNANPQVRIFAGYYIAPPPWFIQRYPDELEKYYYNDAQEQEGLRQWPNSAPLASSKWADLSCRALAAFVSHVESQPYAANIIGYALPSGDAGEWYWPGSFTGGMPGYSVATTQSFREWLRKKYDGDALSLQKAWQRSDINFENAPVPSPAERKASERWAFRDPVKARNVLDFRRYLDDTTYALVKRTTTTAKDASNWKKIVQIYYGYSLLYAGRGDTLQKGGIFNLDRILKLPSVDILVSPIDYVKRRGGQPGLNINGFSASAALHGKQVWREEDLRTHYWPRIEFGRFSDTTESVGAILRGGGYSLSNNGMGLWFTAQAGNAIYHQTAMMETIRDLAKTFEDALKVNRHTAAEVALIFDDPSLLYLAAQSGSFILDHCWGVYENATLMGAPFDVYISEDLDKMPDYKLYIFMNQYNIDTDLAEKIKTKVRKNNAVSVWCYAPGYIQGDQFSVSGMKDITGIFLQEKLKQSKLSLRISETAHAITAYTEKLLPYDVGPQFEVADEQATVLGYADGKPALAVREFDGIWRSVYSLFPLSKELLMGLCDYAGVHVYSRSFDVLTANQSYLMLHAVSDGTKHINFPSTKTVMDAISRQVVSTDTQTLQLDMHRKETRIFQLK